MELKVIPLSLFTWLCSPCSSPPTPQRSEVLPEAAGGTSCSHPSGGKWWLACPVPSDRHHIESAAQGQPSKAPGTWADIILLVSVGDAHLSHTGASNTQRIAVLWAAIGLTECLLTPSVWPFFFSQTGKQKKNLKQTNKLHGSSLSGIPNNNGRPAVEQYANLNANCIQAVTKKNLSPHNRAVEVYTQVIRTRELWFNFRGLVYSCVLYASYFSSGISMVRTYPRRSLQSALLQAAARTPSQNCSWIW